jgi:hypothetical protein
LIKEPACSARRFSSDAVIGESLEWATDPPLKPATLGAALAAATDEFIAA